MQPRISRGGILELFTKIAFAAALLVLILAVPSVSAPLPPGGTTYLSNLQWASATNGWGPVERDMSNGETAARDGKAITLNGATYAKGLGVHATSKLRYNLGGNYDAFTAKVGVDDEVGANGSVTFEVHTDGTKVYDSGLMRGDTATKDVSVDVTGKNKLRLVVTNGGDGDGHDHADWADAKLHAASQQEPPPPSPSSSERKVFAHYMLAYYAYSNPPTVADMKREIQLAQANGIDGFALNAGSWQNEPHYVSRADTMYQAATELGSGFKLYFSADMCCILGDHPEWVREMVTRYYDSPAQYKVDGKPLLSTFSGEDTTFGYPSVQEGWQRAVLNPLETSGHPVAFVPNFYPGSTEHPSQADIAETYNAHSYVDGLYYFGAIARGAEGVAPAVASNTAYDIETDARPSKVFMAGGTSYYYSDVPNNNRVAGNYAGYQGMADIWEGIIQDKPAYVEWVTWNDFQETSYIGPVSSNGVQNEHHVGNMAHNGYLKLMKYYADWYRTGIKPTITRDKLFYAYRTHDKDIQIPNAPIGKPWGWDTLEDRLYVTAHLASPATVRIISGGVSTDFALGAGIHEVSVPFGTGSQRVELHRNGSLIFGESGGAQIVDTGRSRYDYNHYADSVTGP